MQTMASVNSKVYIICLLDSLTTALFLPILSSHIFQLGGTHTVVGVLGTLFTTFQLTSIPLIRSWSDVCGQKKALILSVFINFITYLIIGTTTSYAVIVLLRLICALTNQTQTICKSYVSQFNSQEVVDTIYNVMSAVTIAGFIFGPIIGGTMYESLYGFYRISLLASVTQLFCFLTCFTLPSMQQVEIKERTSFKQKCLENYKYSVESLKKVNYFKDWDVLALKYFYNVSVSVFFIKFSLLLKVHYRACPTKIGYTYAYQSILTFLSHLFVSSVKNKFNPNLVTSLFAVATGLMGLCFAPSYDIYLVSYFLMILAHSFINSNWKELFKLRSEEKYNIENAEDAIGKISSIMTPIIFGVFCDLYGHYALKTFVILPLILNISIVMFTSRSTPIPLVPKKEE